LCHEERKGETVFPGAVSDEARAVGEVNNLAAELCRFYGIAVTPQTVLGHGEVQANLGIAQNGKWDPMALPWEPTWDPSVVGTHLRSMVANALEGRDSPDEQPAHVSISLFGAAIVAGVVVDGAVLVPVAAVADLGFANRRSLRHLDIKAPAKSNGLQITQVAGGEYVRSDDLSRVLGANLKWNATNHQMDVSRVDEPTTAGTSRRRTVPRNRGRKKAT
jgi:hypothetical protein